MSFLEIQMVVKVLQYWSRVLLLKKIYKNLFRPVDLGRLRVRPRPSARDSFPLVTCGFLQRRTKGRPSGRLHSDAQVSQQETPKTMHLRIGAPRVWHSEGGKRETVSSVYFLVLAKILP